MLLKYPKLVKSKLLTQCTTVTIFLLNKKKKERAKATSTLIKIIYVQKIIKRRLLYKQKTN